MRQQRMAAREGQHTKLMTKGNGETGRFAQSDSKGQERRSCATGACESAT